MKPITKPKLRNYTGIFSNTSTALQKLLDSKPSEKPPTISRFEQRKKNWKENMKNHIEKKKEEYLECKTENQLYFSTYFWQKISSKNMMFLAF